MVDKEFITEYIDSVQDVLVDVFGTSKDLHMGIITNDINGISLVMCDINRPSLETMQLLEEVKIKLTSNIKVARNVRKGVNMTKNDFKID